MWKDLKKIEKNHVFAAEIESFSSAIVSFSDVIKTFLDVKRGHFRAQKAVLFWLNQVWKNIFFRCKNHTIFSEKKDSTFSTNTQSSHAFDMIKTLSSCLQASHW